MPRIEVTQRSTVVAEPVTHWDFLKTNTIGMVQPIAVIAVHQHILVIIFLANLTWLGIV